MPRYVLLLPLVFALAAPGCNQPKIRTDQPEFAPARDIIVDELAKEGLSLQTARPDQIAAAAQVAFGASRPVVAAQIIDDSNPATEDPIEVTFESPAKAIAIAAGHGFLSKLTDFSVPTLVGAGAYALAGGLSTLFAYVGLRRTPVGPVTAGDVVAAVVPKVLKSKTIFVAALLGFVTTLKEIQSAMPDEDATTIGLVSAAAMVVLRTLTGTPLGVQTPAPAAAGPPPGPPVA